MPTEQQATPDQQVLNQLAIGKAQAEVSLMYAQIEIEQLKAQLAQYQPQQGAPVES